MATTARYGYNPNRAGENLLKFCTEARKTLLARLVKPSITDEAAFEAFVLAKAAIRNMDHNELRAALAQPAAQPALGYANHIGYSDVNPYEVVREVSAKIIEVRRMAAQLDPTWKPEMHAGGFAAHCSNQHSQRWNITSDEAAPVIRLHLRKDGCFYYKGSKFRREAEPRKFHDYNF